MSHLNFSLLIKCSVLLASVILSGCADPVEDDLQQFIDSVANNKVEDIEAIPTLNPIKPSTYQAFHLRSPFDPSTLATSQHPLNTINDSSRPKEALESYPFDSLKMIGYLKKNTHYAALIQDPNGHIHQAYLHDYLGQHNGMIQIIDEDGLTIAEEECVDSEHCSERTLRLPISISSIISHPQ